MREFDQELFENEYWECTNIERPNEDLGTIVLQPKDNVYMDKKLNFLLTLPEEPDGWEWDRYDGFTVHTDGTFAFSLVSEEALHPHAE